MITPPIPPERSIPARELATRLIGALRSELPQLLDFDGIDLGPAAEQALFLAFRAPTGTVARGRAARPARSFARLAYAFGSSLARRRLPPVQGRIVAIVLNPAHQEILRAVEPLVGAAGISFVMISDGSARSKHVPLPPLSAFLSASHASAVLSKTIQGGRDLRRAPGSWSDLAEPRIAQVAAGIVRGELQRSALDTACLEAIAQDGPSLVLTFDEIGRRGRLLGPVAARHAVPTLDLPHAEAADPYAIHGATYDVFGVFGPRARAVLQAADIPDSRIRELGAPRFDELIRRRASAPVSPRRLVFASQWLGGQMTADVKRATLRMAVHAASLAAPSELVIKPHPIESDDLAEEVLAGAPIPGVITRVDHAARLYDLLDGAWALFTGWSNSVFESILSGVPPVCLTATGGPPPTTFASEGLALGAANLDEVAGVVARLLRENERAMLLRQARIALSEHLGPLDGRASERTASLILELATR